MVMLLLLVMSQGRSQSIFSVYTTPTSAGATTYLRGIGVILSDYSPCAVTYDEIEHLGDNHIQKARLCVGTIATPCYLADTFDIGVLNPGVNHVVLQLLVDADDSTGGTCSDFVPVDTSEVSVNIAFNGGGIAVNVDPPQAPPLCAGDSMQFQTIPEQGVTYQWLRNGQNIAGATQPSIWVHENGDYQLRLYQFGDSGTSFPVYQRFHPIPTSTIDQQAYTLELTTPGATHQWMELQSGAVAGATGPTLEVTQTGNYYCLITSAYNCVGSSDTLYAEMLYPTLDPGDSTSVCAGNTRQLTATPFGNQYQYRWFRNNQLIPGAVASQYGASDSGHFRVEVRIAQTIDTSSATVVSLRPNPTPTITWFGGQLVSTAAHTYQWYRVGSGPIQGATQQQLIFVDQGIYYVEVTYENGCESTSNTIEIWWHAVGDDLSDQSCDVHMSAQSIEISCPASQNGPVTITDLLGREVGRFYMKGAQVQKNLNNLPGGIYVVRIEPESGEVVLQRVFIP